MNSFDEYMANALSGVAQCSELERFRKKMLSYASSRRSELAKVGLTDAETVEGILIKEHPDLKAEYAAFCTGKGKKAKSGFYFFLLRACLFLVIVLVAVFVFLVFQTVFHFPNSYLIILAGVALGLIADAVVLKKNHRGSASGMLCVYLPFVAALIYVIGGISGFIPWHPGWLIIVAAAFAGLCFLLLKAIGKVGGAK